MTTNMIETKNITKRFKNETVLSNVTIHIRENTVYGLLGPNGAGKSTLLKLITGILQPSSGEIWINGEPWKREDLAHIGSLIEQPAIYDNLSARENLQVVANLLNVSQRRIGEVLTLVDLSNTGGKQVGKFSMGMRQRLGIALALLNKPKILILDEPTNGLDPLGIQELRELIQGFPKQGMTVILSSHILSEVEMIADDIGIISNGRLGYEGKNNKEEDLETLFMDIVKKHQNTEWSEII